MPRKALPARLKQIGEVWYVIYTNDGRSQRDSLRTEDIQIAQQRFQGWLKSRNEDQISKKPQTLANACRQFIEQHGPTVVDKEGLVFSFKKIVLLFGDKRLIDISRKEIEAYTAARLAGEHGWKPVKPGTVRRELIMLRSVFNFMIKRVEPKECRVNASELAYIPVPSRPPPRKRVLSTEELILIRSICKPHERIRMSRINRYMWLLMETGARSEALRTLKWEQVDLKTRLITLNPWGRNQTKKHRPIIPISDDLHAVLAIAKEQAKDAWVLDHGGTINKSVERFCERHGLQSVASHTFRHTLATRMAEAGVEMRDIAAMLGDSIPTVENNYLHLSPQYLRGALEKIRVG